MRKSVHTRINNSGSLTYVKVLLASMEVGLWSDVPTYAGGLGVLVGDKLLAAKDMGKKVEAVTFSYPEGYSAVSIDSGELHVEANEYNPLKQFKQKDELTLKTPFGKQDVVLLKKGPIWFIHSPLARRLYIDTPEERLKKEWILGRVAALLGQDYDVLHMEESHAAFAGEFFEGRLVFTTHTPLPHGHEVWSVDLVKKVLGRNDDVNMTRLALEYADYANCVSRMQRAVMRPILGKNLDYITNAVHKRWVHKAIAKEVGNRENFRGPLDSKLKAKEELVRFVNSRAYLKSEFEIDRFTIGIARRFTGYKRLDLLLDDLSALDGLGIQVIYAGTLHPADIEGRKMVEKVIDAINKLKNTRIAFLPHYNIDTAKKLIAGVDAWLNLPIEEYEASGTSWMKALLNGSILISTASGSVPEFVKDGANGLIISKDSRENQARQLLEKIKLAMKRFDSLRTSAIKTTGLLADRMMQEYFDKAYSPKS